MSKDKFTAAEWELVKDAPYWVYAALAAADGKVSFFTRRRENKALDKVLREFKTTNPLIEAMIADESDPAKATENATQADAEKALNRIAALVEQKLGADGLDAMSAFLMQVGNTVAAASKEGGSGTAKMVSEKEAAALKSIEKALMKTGVQTHATAAPKPAPKPAAATTESMPGTTMGTAAPKRDDDAKQNLEQARREAEERQKQAAAEREAKAKAEADAKQKDNLEQARREAEERQQQAAAEREAKAKAEAEAKAKAEAAQTLEAAEAKAAPKYTQFIAEHTVQPGDNLSFISQRYYGTQANFRILYEANRDVIGDNMNLIKPGQVLKIPKL